MVTGGQNVRDGTPLENLWSCIVRIFQETTFKTLFRPGLLVAHDARQKSHTGIDQDHSRQFTTRQDIIANGNLFQATRLNHPFVNTFKPTANEQCTIS